MEQLRERARELGNMVALGGIEWIALMNTDGEFCAKTIEGHSSRLTEVQGWKLVKQLCDEEGVYALTHKGELLSAFEGTTVFLWDVKEEEIDHIVTMEDGRIVGLTVEGRAFVSNRESYSLEDSNVLREELQSWGELKFLKALNYGGAFFGITKDETVHFYDIRSYHQEESKRVKNSVKNWKNICDVVLVEWRKDRYDVVGVKNDGTLVTTYHDEKLDIFKLDHVLQIEGNDLNRSYILLADGRLFMYRYRNQTLLAEDIVSIRGFGSHIVYIKKDGTVDSTSKPAVDYKDFRLFHSLEKYKEEINVTLENTRQYLETLDKEKKELEAMLPGLQGIFKKKQREQVESRIRELDRLALCYVPNVRSSGTSYSIDQISAGLQARSAAYTEKKDASVIKSAAVGAIIAGPTGAVVGAIHAADKNNRNKKDK